MKNLKLKNCHSLTKIKLAIIAALLLQIAFWYYTESIKPEILVVPDLPSKQAVEALSLGDKAFYFRVLAIKIQNAGDTFERYIALKDYDYEKLYQWFTLLDTLDSRSHLIPALGSYYYSNTQNKEDLRYIIRYLDEHYDLNPKENWWWLFQAAYLADSILKDKPLALELANKLSKTPNKNLPIWAKQMPAFIYKDMGDACSAYKVIMPIIDDTNITPTTLKKPL